MKKFTLFPKMSLPGKIVTVLSYLIVGMCLLMLITGIIVRDNSPAAAQVVEPTIEAPAIAAETPEAVTAPHESTETPTSPAIDQAAQAAVDSAAKAAADGALNSAAQATANDAAQATANDTAQATANDALNSAAQVDDANAVAQDQAKQPATPESDYYVAPGAAKAQSDILIERKKAEDTTGLAGRLMSIVGILGFLGIAYVMSNNRKKILWKLVAIGTILQLLFAMFILWTPVGKAIFAVLNDGITVLLDFTKAGSSFLFASYVSGTIESANVHTAMSILPPIIFFSSLMTVLYHLGVMQWIVKGLAAVMVRFMGTSGSETLSAVSNIFVGQTEAPLVVKPYVKTMTKSELFAVMTGGFATVAGGVMASYVAMLQPYFPDIAGHMIAASVMSAPATLVVAKMIFPETEESETRGEYKLDNLKQDANVIDAAARGASEGMQLAINVAAMLIAFVAIIALINFFLGLPSRTFNANTYQHVEGYVISSGEKMPDNCSNPYTTSDTLACTHIGLMTIAKANGIALDESITALSDDQNKRIEQIETAYNEIVPRVGGSLDNTRMFKDCRDNHNIAACGAVLATTQNKAWTPSLEKERVIPLISLEYLLGWLFFPIAFLMGVPSSDCFLVGQLLGEKMGINEFVAYLHLANIMENLSYRSIVISTYALCGFANFGSIAIQIGGIGGMAPERRADLAKMGIKAMIAGSIAAFMTATIAGALV